MSTPLISTYQKHRKEKQPIRPREQKAINRTINKELSYLSAFRKWVGEETGVVCPPVLFRSLPYRRPLPKILTMEEVAGIIAAAEDDYKGIILTIAHLGLRITPARMLRWRDVNWGTKSVRAIVKGGRELILPLSDDLVDWLEKKRTQNIYDSPWLFPSRVRPKHPISDVRKALQRAKEAAGITKRVHPHLFRHSAGAHLIASGVDLRVVQELLGHSDVRMTEWYTQVVLISKQDALRKAGHIKKRWSKVVKP